jgi:hypothetical protein
MTIENVVKSIASVAFCLLGLYALGVHEAFWREVAGVTLIGMSAHVWPWNYIHESKP